MSATHKPIMSSVKWMNGDITQFGQMGSHPAPLKHQVIWLERDHVQIDFQLLFSYHIYLNVKYGFLFRCDTMCSEQNVCPMLYQEQG